MSPSLDALRALGLLGPLDVHFARALAARVGETRPEVCVTAALTSRQAEAGHVCLDLDRLLAGSLTLDLATDTGALDLPPLAPLLAALRSSPLVDLALEGARPLVLDAGHRLYLRRHFEAEQRLASQLVARAAGEVPLLDEATLRRGLERLFPATADGVPDLQRRAAELAVRRRFSVISGGPGTGKTSTVVKILALLIEQAFAAGAPGLAMHLLAPTGKAALRLREAIEAAKQSIDCAPRVREAIVGDATTLHRALGVLPGPGIRFRHDARSPLLTDLVLVDEASMVDLGLMARLFDAVPDRARILLLGDQDQLASVEAGAVLGDICGAGAREDADGPIAGCITRLTRSYRYPEGSGIARLARAIGRGAVGEVRALLERELPPDLEWMPGEPHRAPSAELVARAAEGYRPMLEAPDRDGRLARRDEFRVLCAHRRGPAGLAEVDAAVAARLATQGLLLSTSLHAPGRPVMVTRNDYTMGLFNGDVGLCDRDDAGGLRVFFPVRPGEVRAVAPARLPAHESVFAMSIHKSQGSEFDEILVVLPAEGSPLLSRELLYTAVTRARRKVILHGSFDAIARAVTTPVDRATGLRDALWSR